MNVIEKLFFGVVLFASVSCGGEYEKDMFPKPEVNVKGGGDFRYDMDTLVIDTMMSTTFVGSMGVHQNKLYFLDRLACTIHFFDSTGKVLFRSLGSGRGPTETTIGEIRAHCFLDDGYLCLQGGSDDVVVFTPEFKEDQSKSYRKQRRPYGREDKIGYDQFELYSMGNPLVCRSHGSSVFTNNQAGHPMFNYFQTPDVFVEEFRNITEQRLDKKETGRLLGRGMPGVYKDKSDTHFLFSSTFFDIDGEGSFYVAYMADSLIYKYDKDYSPVYSFGFEGRGMDKEYASIKLIEDIRTKGVAQYKTKGYYTWVEYIDELGYLLRSYSKGEKELSDGLQIYKDRTLIADIDVPKGFKPVGYVAPYIFSDAVVDEGRMQMRVYRIKVR